MNTNTSIFAGTIGLLVAGTAMAGMNGLSYDIIDQVGDGAQAGTYTVRVYAELDADSRLDAVFGNSNFGLQIQYMGGASAYQNTTFGAPTSTGINEAFFPLAPSLEWDSYMTIGRLYSADNALQDIGIDWSNWEAGGDLPASGVVDNGTFFITPANAQGEAVDGRVLVAQLTTYATHGDGVIDAYFTAGFQGSTGADGWQQQHSIYIDAIPAPGAIALLGLAGLAGRRRRRA